MAKDTLSDQSLAQPYKYIKLDRKGQVFVITLDHGAENKLNLEFCREIVRAFHTIQTTLGPDSEGAVITRGNNSKFFCTGVDLDDARENPFMEPDGFFPMLHTILDFPYPTIACVTGHTFGGACLFSLAHDYRIMNADQGYFSMVPVNLGLHWDGIGALPKAKLMPQVARKLLLEAHRFTGKEALADGVVDAIAPPTEMDALAEEFANRWKSKAKMNVYGVLRGELVGEPLQRLKMISFVHGQRVSRPIPEVKL